MTVTFSEPRVCTITATVNLGSPVNIIDTAKFAEPSGDVSAVRLSYAGGRSAVSKGMPPKKARKSDEKKRSFSNQVTLMVPLPDSIARHACCRVFSTGVVHICGARSIEDLDYLLSVVKNVLLSVTGTMRTLLNEDLLADRNILVATDHIMYSNAGKIIGWASWDESLYYLDDGGVVDMEFIRGSWTFVQSQWTKGVKKVYTTNGKLLGEKRLDFFPGAGRRYYVLKGDDILIGSVLVGKIVTDIDTTTIDTTDPKPEIIDGHLVRAFSGLANKDLDISPFEICMVNTYFACSHQIDRHKLHQAFLADGYYSRFDPCVTPGVNFRFYDNTGQRKLGVCQCVGKCSCKRVSILCHISGSLIVAGLRDIAHGRILQDFICNYYAANIDRFVATDKKSALIDRQKKAAARQNLDRDQHDDAEE